jgi:hypothetical protein
MGAIIEQKTRYGLLFMLQYGALKCLCVVGEAHCYARFLPIDLAQQHDHVRLRYVGVAI